MSETPSNRGKRRTNPTNARTNLARARISSGVGIGAHRLRSAAARFLEWFRICLRNGYLPGYKGKRNPAQAKIRNANDRIRTTRNGRR